MSKPAFYDPRVVQAYLDTIRQVTWKVRADGLPSAADLDAVAEEQKVKQLTGGESGMLSGSVERSA